MAATRVLRALNALQPLALLSAVCLASCSGDITDSPTNVTQIELNHSSINLTAGESVQLSAIPKSAQGVALDTRMIQWSSSNSAIVVVTESGVATGIAAGTATVTARAGNTAASVSFTVIGRPNIGLSASTVSITTLAGTASPSAQTVSITNTGGGTVAGLAVVAIQYEANQPTDWLSANLSSTTAPSTLSLQATLGNLSAGTYKATVTLIATTADNNPQTVIVTFVVRPTFLLSVEGAGGNGTVSGGGINCTIAAGTAVTGACALLLESGATVTLAAAAAATETFKGWGGACGGTSTCVITMSAARAVTARFGPPEYALTVVGAGTGTGTVSGSGINCTIAVGVASGTCQITQVVNTQIQFTSTVTSGNTFVGWSGACSGSGNPCAVTLTANQTVTATFDVIPPGIVLSPSTVTMVALQGGANPPPAQVSITNSGGVPLTGLALGAVQYSAGSGWLTAGLSSTTANPSSTVTLQASTALLSAGTYTANVPVTSNVAINSPQTIAITVVVTGNYTLTIAGSGTGNGAVSGAGISCTVTASTTSGACSTTVLGNATIQLSAGASGPNHTFFGWSGCSNNTSASITVTVRSNTACTAIFYEPTAPTLSSVSGGLVGINNPACAYIGGSEFAFTFNYSDVNGNANTGWITTSGPVRYPDLWIELTPVYQPTDSTSFMDWSFYTPATSNEFAGVVNVTACVVFGAATSATFTFELLDATRMYSNGASVTFGKPAGAHDVNGPTASTILNGPGASEIARAGADRSEGGGSRTGLAGPRAARITVRARASRIPIRALARAQSVAVHR